MRIAMIKDGIVANIAVHDGEAVWEPEGFDLVDITDHPDQIGPGFIYDRSVFPAVFIAPAPKPKPLLERMEEVFFSQDADLQGMFSGPMSLMEKLISKGQITMARDAMMGVPIPQELSDRATPVRESLLAILNAEIPAVEPAADPG